MGYSDRREIPREPAASRCRYSSSRTQTHVLKGRLRAPFKGAPPFPPLGPGRVVLKQNTTPSDILRIPVSAVVPPFPARVRGLALAALLMSNPCNPTGVPIPTGHPALGSAPPRRPVSLFLYEAGTSSVIRHFMCRFLCCSSDQTIGRDTKREW